MLRELRFSRGTSSWHGLTVARSLVNSGSTVPVLLVNLGRLPVYLHRGERIALLKPITCVQTEEASEAFSSACLGQADANTLAQPAASSMAAPDVAPGIKQATPDTRGNLVSQVDRDRSTADVGSDLTTPPPGSSEMGLPVTYGSLDVPGLGPRGVPPEFLTISPTCRGSESPAGDFLPCHDLTMSLVGPRGSGIGSTSTVSPTGVHRVHPSLDSIGDHSGGAVARVSNPRSTVPSAHAGVEGLTSCLEDISVLMELPPGHRSGSRETSPGESSRTSGQRVVPIWHCSEPSRPRGGFVPSCLTVRPPLSDAKECLRCTCYMQSDLETIQVIGPPVARTLFSKPRIPESNSGLVLCPKCQQERALVDKAKNYLRAFPGSKIPVPPHVEQWVQKHGQVAHVPSSAAEDEPTLVEGLGKTCTVNLEFLWRRFLTQEFSGDAFDELVALGRDTDSSSSESDLIDSDLDSPEDESLPGDESSSESVDSGISSREMVNAIQTRWYNASDDCVGFVRR